MKILFALLAALATTTAVAQTREVQEKRLAEYLPYAGQPVEKFQFWDLIRYELVGEYKVIVWPRLNEAYLITVDAPCNDLEWAHSIGLTSSVHQVNRRFDFVVAGKDKCRIKEIRPIDYKKYLADRKESKDSGKR